MKYSPLVHACLLTSAAQLAAAAAITNVSPEIPGTANPLSNTVDESDAANNADCIPGQTCGTFTTLKTNVYVISKTTVSGIVTTITSIPSAVAGADTPGEQGAGEQAPTMTMTDGNGNIITVPEVTNKPATSVPPTASEVNGYTSVIADPIPPKPPTGGSIEPVPMVTTTDVQGNTIIVPNAESKPVTLGPTADEASLSVTLIGGNTPIIADPIPPTPPASVVGGNAGTSSCDGQVISDPIPPKPPVLDIPAADQVYTTTDVRGNVFTVPAWLPEPTHGHQADEEEPDHATMHGHDSVRYDPISRRDLPTGRQEDTTIGGLPGFADPTTPIHSATEGCGENEVSTGIRPVIPIQSTFEPVITRPPGGHGVTVSSISPGTVNASSFMYVDPVPAKPTTDAAGNVIRQPSSGPHYIDPIPEGLLPSIGSGVTDIPVTPHKIYGDGHIMTPVQLVQQPTTTHDHLTRPTKVINSEGQTVQIDARPPRPSSVDLSGIESFFSNPILPGVQTSDALVFVDPIPSAPPTSDSIFYPDTNQGRDQSTPTPTTASSSIPALLSQACGPATCGTACPTGTGGWVTLAPIDCPRVPINTIGQLPTVKARRDSVVHVNLQPGRDLKRRANTPSISSAATPLPSGPLPDLPGHGAQVAQYLTSIAEKLTSKGAWFNHNKGDVTGKWYEFTDAKTAAGVAGLYGCTSVFIVSKEGVYVSHIYENPVFVYKSVAGFGRFLPTPDDYFRKATLDALVHGDEKSGLLEPIEALVGTTARPGPLHYTNQPQVFIVTPFKNGGTGPLTYPERVAWLSDELYGYLYPPGTGGYAQKPMTLPYKIAPRNLAESPASMLGEAIMEATKIRHYNLVGDKLVPIGRWRLWVNAEEAVTWEFSGQVEGLARRQDAGSGGGGASYAGICPVSKLPSSMSTPTTMVTTTTPVIASSPI